VLLQKMALFGNPVVYSIDCKRFDQHVSREQLKISHMIYRSCHSDPEFEDLMKQTLNNRCFTFGGWRYKTRGRRMSGDMDTALGNCLIMVTMVIAFMKSVELKEYEMFVDGDDTLLIVSKENEHKIVGLVEAFLRYGHEIKLEGRAERYEDVVWCQAKVCDFSQGPLMVRDWRKVLSAMCAGTRHWHERDYKPMARGVGLCLLAVCPGVPIIQAFALKLAGLSNKINEEIYMADIMFKVRPVCKDISKVKPGDVTDHNRDEFERVFGVPFDEQKRIENAINGWAIGGGHRDIPDEIAYGWVLEPDLRSVPAVV
jgi:hypothetical protein